MEHNNTGKDLEFFSKLLFNFHLWKAIGRRSVFSFDRAALDGLSSRQAKLENFSLFLLWLFDLLFNLRCLQSFHRKAQLPSSPVTAEDLGIRDPWPFRELAKEIADLIQNYEGFSKDEFLETYKMLRI